MSQTVFVIYLYNKYNKLDKVVHKFRINGRWWAIKEVPLLWGSPQLASLEADDPMGFHLYNTLDEALEYVKTIKSLEGVKF